MAAVRKTPQALREQTDRLREFVAENPGVPVADIGYSLAVGRTHLDHRAVYLGRDHDEFTLTEKTPHPLSPDDGSLCCSVARGLNGWVWVVSCMAVSRCLPRRTTVRRGCWGFRVA